VAPTFILSSIWEGREGATGFKHSKIITQQIVRFMLSNFFGRKDFTLEHRVDEVEARDILEDPMHLQARAVEQKRTE